MVRAAAKNYSWVGIATDPVQYDDVIAEVLPNEKAEVIKKIRNVYAKDRGQAILTELLATFKEFELL